MDKLLGGGLREGKVVEFFGRSNTGKTQLAMQSALCEAQAGGRTLFVDTEGAFRPERIEEMAVARGWRAGDLLNRIVYVRCDSASAQMETIRGMAAREATKSCHLVVIDTLTRNFTVDMPGAANLQSRQAALNVHLSEVARDAYNGARAYLLTNRVTFGSLHDVSIGGRTAEQLVSESIRLDREGGTIACTMVKSGISSRSGIGARGIE